MNPLTRDFSNPLMQRNPLTLRFQHEGGLWEGTITTKRKVRDISGLGLTRIGPVSCTASIRVSPGVPKVRFTNCLLYPSNTVLLAGTNLTPGAGFVDIPLPNLPGVSFFTQAVVFDANANPLGLGLSNPAQGLIG